LTAYLNRSSVARISLVVPCFNEARRLDLEKFHRFLAESMEVRIFFVDDGSRDETLAILRAFQQGHEHRVQVLAHQINQGKAEAVRTGIIFALSNFQQEMIGYWDADLSTPLESVMRLASILDGSSHIEMVFGSRVKLCGRHIERRLVRHYLGRVFATVVSTMLRIPIYDTQCGAKIFRVTQETKRIYSEPFLSKWVFDVEILARYMRLYSASVLEKKIYEYPLETWADVAGSKVRPKDFFRAFVDIAKIKRKYLKKT
jgi:dolichyl-phosphate beta-glucosyltransferase